MSCFEEYEGIGNQFAEEVEKLSKIYSDDDMFIQFTIAQECPKSRCNGYVQKIEEDLIPIIKVLKQKGYPVKNISIGQKMYDSMRVSWIEFDESVKSIPKLPEFWSSNDEVVVIQDIGEEEESNFVITDIIEEENEMDYIETVCHCKIELINWAKELPKKQDSLSAKGLTVKEKNILTFKDY